MDKRLVDMEGPPLWVWAIIVGLIVASKFVYRGKLIKGLAKSTKQSDKSFSRTKINWTAINNEKLTDHKYNPQLSPGRFKDYEATKKAKKIACNNLSQ